jgi:hypothetical protein
MVHVGIGLVPFEPEFRALGVHVRFTERERVDIRLVFQVRQGVVDEPVSAFVRTDGIYDVQQGCIMLETPVIFRYLGSRMVGPLWETAFFDIFDAFLLFRMSGGGDCKHDAGHTNRVREHRLLLEMSHELSGPGQVDSRVGLWGLLTR